jgi:O-antigen/teichoic acid export membrane protein
MTERIIASLEKLLKTDVRYLANGGFWLMGGHGMQILSGLILAIAFANLLPRTSFGTYQFIMSGAAILGALTLGMAIPVKRASAKGEDGALRFGFRTQLQWSIGIVILGVCLSSYYFYNDNSTLGKSFLVIGALSPLIGSFSLYKSFLIGKQKFRESALLGFWLRPMLLVTVLTSLYFTDDPFILILVYFVTSASATSYLYFRTISKYRLPKVPDLNLFKYAKHLTFLSIVGTIGNQADKLLIFHFLGAVQVAIYTLAMLPTTHLLKLFTVLGELIFPKFAQRKYSAIKKGMLHKVFTIFILTLGTVGIFILLAPYIYLTIFPAYPEAIFFSQIAILTLLPKCGNLFTQAFYAHEMKKEMYIVRFSTIAIKLILLCVLIPYMGLLGAIMAVLITRTYWFIISAAFFYLRSGNAK